MLLSQGFDTFSYFNIIFVSCIGFWYDMLARNVGFNDHLRNMFLWTPFIQGSLEV